YDALIKYHSAYSRKRWSFTYTVSMLSFSVPCSKCECSALNGTRRRFIELPFSAICGKSLHSCTIVAVNGTQIAFKYLRDNVIISCDAIVFNSVVRFRYVFGSLSIPSTNFLFIVSAILSSEDSSEKLT